MSSIAWPSSAQLDMRHGCQHIHKSLLGCVLIRLDDLQPATARLRPYSAALYEK